MGRELRRVPFDFDYPLNTVWYGYFMDYIPNTCMSTNEDKKYCKSCKEYAKIKGIEKEILKHKTKNKIAFLITYPLSINVMKKVSKKEQHKSRIIKLITYPILIMQKKYLLYWFYRRSKRKRS